MSAHMDLWVYARTSGDIGETGQDVKAQMEMVTQRVTSLGHNVVGYSLDDGVSGDSNPSDRKGWKEALRACSNGAAAGIAVAEISRFSRQEPTEALQLWNSIRSKGVRFLSLKEGFFTTLEDGEEDDSLVVIRFIALWSSWHELKVLRARTAIVMEEIKTGRRVTKSGKMPGRPVVTLDPEHEEKIKVKYQETKSLAEAHRLALDLRGFNEAKDPATKKKRAVSKGTVAKLLGLRTKTPE